MKTQFKVDDIVCMQESNGWGFHPKHNGRLAVVEEVGIRRDIHFMKEGVEYVSGRLIPLDEEEGKEVEFSHVPVYNRGEAGDGKYWSVRHATHAEEALMQTQEIEI